MAEFVNADIVEEILIGLNVKDLIRFKSVCRSWHSLITSPRFIRRHLRCSYNKDHYNDEFGQRRIDPIRCLNLALYYHFAGSSNGMVCIICHVCSCKVLVGNPLTREVRQLGSLPPGFRVPLFWGFGYDSSRDDYKVIVGGWNGKNQTCAHVLSLKSNIWRVTEEVKFTRAITKAGILSNGALHWIVKDQNNKKLIISYDLSKEEYREVPQPDDARYQCASNIKLGIIKECLCVCVRDQPYSPVIWLMKVYNAKVSWELLPRDHEMKRDIVYNLGIGEPWFSGNSECFGFPRNYIDAPIFVQSLVSPYLNM